MSLARNPAAVSWTEAELDEFERAIAVEVHDSTRGGTSRELLGFARRALVTIRAERGERPEGRAVPPATEPPTPAALRLLAALNAAESARDRALDELERALIARDEARESAARIRARAEHVTVRLCQCGSGSALESAIARLAATLREGAEPRP